MKLSPVYVKIQQFQSIENLDFEVSGFTCVTGKTNIGKSAILRAMSGALLNKPVTGLVRTGAKSCSVKLSSQSAEKPWGLLWEKAEKNLNRYTIEGKTEKLENVGQGQPGPVADLGFNCIRIGDKDLYPWYAPQWSPLFLLDEGGPTITQFISEISGLNVLQDAIILSLKSKRQALEELKSVEAEISSAQIDIGKVSGLEELETIVDELKSQAESVDEYKRRISRCKDLLKQITESAHFVRALEPVLSTTIPEGVAAHQMSALCTMRDLLKKLEKMALLVITIKPIGEIAIQSAPADEYAAWVGAVKHSEIFRLKESVDTLGHIESVPIPEAVDPAEIDELMRARRHRGRISDLQKSIFELDVQVPILTVDALEMKKIEKARGISREIQLADAEISNLERRRTAAETELESIIEELNKIPSCPTCNRPIIEKAKSRGCHETGGR